MIGANNPEFHIYIHCDDNPILNSWTKKKYLLAADKRLGLNVFKEFDESQPDQDFVLNIQPCDTTIWSGKKWTGLWHIDCMLEGYQFPRQYFRFNTIFLASTSTIKKPENSMLLFQAADTTWQKRYPNINQDYDFVLCGTNRGTSFYDERERLIELMKSKFSYKDFGKNFPPPEFAKNYNSAKVQWIQSGVSRGKGSCAQRFFECLAIGPVLTNWSEDRAHTGLIEGTDYMSYSTDEEMIWKMEMLLTDEKLRNHIAKNGREKSILYHSYEQRAMAIINVVREFDK